MPKAHIRRNGIITTEFILGSVKLDFIVGANTNIPEWSKLNIFITFGKNIP